jgi:hypothetical protein
VNRECNDEQQHDKHGSGAMSDTLESYLLQLTKLERQFAEHMWEALAAEPRPGARWPEYDVYNLTFHRALEIQGVLEYYDDLRDARSLSIAPAQAP